MFSDRTKWKLTRNRLTEALEQMRASGARVLDLTLSNPTRAGLVYDEPRILQSLASPQAMDYDPQPKGLPSAREAITAYYRTAHGIQDFDPERLILTTSTSEGYSFVFRLLCNPGDELLIPKPSYPLFEFLADLQDVRLVPYPLIYDHGWQMDFPSLEKVVTKRTRGVVVVHPNNPTGSYVHAHEQESLNSFCHEHGLAIIADEVFLDYAHSGPPLRSFGENQDVLTFTLSGVSKISALPQMKVAWLATSGPSAEVESAQARLEVISDTYLSMNAPIQWALPALLGQRASIQQQLLNRVRDNLAKLDRQLAGQQACQRLSVEAGWYAILRVPVTQTDEELAVDLLRRKSVLVHPGHFYDFPSDGYLVLSLIAQPAEFAEAVQRLLGMAHL
ncbi:MAG TPA: pyridoxal phosphate-dependent aminotransferase [Candidatus Sulfotelmatobacter sp.]|jgi:aspartate/methionine/tyrosine aminotransferase|nr:pyridoxal phosphate-dependent aminotransferase [Candidatus Sulfotelmatobacter sp.]